MEIARCIKPTVEIIGAMHWIEQSIFRDKGRTPEEIRERLENKGGIHLLVQEKKHPSGLCNDLSPTTPDNRNKTKRS
ncbi:MAG TPA: hypothetical protein VJK51_04755 [Candidatus Nanoarchaeia archaeon]|nr:hypothetical protein [Candidatus Nanoarchaeia archaeon]